MYRLGLRLTLRSGREPFVRMVVTAVAVGIGVAIMLCVLADFNAFRATNNRPSWESTRGQSLTANYAAASRAELWNYSDDVYQGQTIERLDIAALGPGAPMPPGISRIPAAGQYYASPALAALIRSVPADELGDRFPGTPAGTIGESALTGPQELVVYVGYQPAKLAALPATTLVTSITSGPGPTIWTHYFRDAFVIGAIAFLFPILILVGTATRLAAARREQRFAALRLVGATTEQVAIIASVEAAVGALLGSLFGIGLFQLLRPALADSAITSARYFPDLVTPTVAGYLLVLIGVPAASAIAALVALRRVSISPLGVSRRATPPATRAARLTTLAVGIVLFALGVLTTNAQRIGVLMLPSLILILAGLVIAGPYLTAQAARLLHRYGRGASPLLAARRLADDPRLAFRAVSGLVLAVFLGTLIGGILPALENTAQGGQSAALSNVLLAGFTTAPVCGNDVNCAGTTTSQINPLAGSPAQQQRIAVSGLPPQPAAALLTGLRAIRGTTVIPVYTAQKATLAHVRPGTSPPPANFAPGSDNGLISCAGLRALAVLGQCAPGVGAVLVPAANLFDDNPRFSTEPIAYAGSPAVAAPVGGLYLQAVLVKVNSQQTLERARTYLVTHAKDSASGTAARTFGEAAEARSGVAGTVERLIYTAVVLTVIVAGCSLAVTVGGSLVERKRPFTLLRLTGTQLSTLYRVVLLETVLPLAAATLLAALLAYLVAILTVSAIAPSSTPVPVPGHTYFLMMGGGLIGALIVIVASLPVLGRITAPETVRFE